jgi:hypothetical protein
MADNVGDDIAVAVTDESNENGANEDECGMVVVVVDIMTGVECTPLFVRTSVVLLSFQVPTPGSTMW